MKLAITLILTILFVSVHAQDQIYKKNKEVIECLIVGVDANVIKYTQEKYTGNEVRIIDKDLVVKVVYASGRYDIINNEPSLEKTLQKQHKSIYKFGLFSPLGGALSLGYERSMRPSRSMEYAIGIIGLGTSMHENARGAYIRAGYKFIKKPEVYKIAGEYAHIMHGAFIRPDLVFSYYSYESYNKSTREDAFSFALLLNFGKQWILDDEFSLSINAGVGYAISTGDEYYYSHYSYGNEFPLALSVGLSIGFLN